MDLTNHPAPAFTLPREDGSLVSLSDFAGQPVVLFFYPKDSTPACTTEAQDFTAALPEFAATNPAAPCIVLGISKDSVKKHANFTKKSALAVPLLSDEHGQTCEAFGTWVEKSMYGKTYMGIERSTFLIGPDGQIKREWRKVKVEGHVTEVLEAVRTL